MREVFISSSTETATVAFKLSNDLEIEGFHTFLPSRDFPLEDADWRFQQKVSLADAFLVLVKSKPKRTPSLEREWFAILNEASDFKKHKKLIPLLVGPGESPNFLKNWQALRVPKPNDAKRWDKLVDTISRALNSTKKPKFADVPKIDLKRREKRLESIAEAARQQLKALEL